MSRGDTFIGRLVAIAEMHKSYVHSYVNEQVGVAILEYASETEENLNGAEHLGYGSVEDTALNTLVAGLKLKHHDTLLSHMARIYESSPLPDSIKAELPEVTQAEWEAFTHFVTLLFLGLESYYPHPKKGRPLPKSERGPRNWHRNS